MSPELRHELADALPDGVALPAAVLACIASQTGVTNVIHGGWDAAAFDRAVRDVYDRHLRADIHPHW